MASKGNVAKMTKKNIFTSKQWCIKPGKEGSVVQGQLLISLFSIKLHFLLTASPPWCDIIVLSCLLVYEILVLPIPCQQLPSRAQTLACTVGCQTLPPANTHELGRAGCQRLLKSKLNQKHNFHHWC